MPTGRSSRWMESSIWPGNGPKRHVFALFRPVPGRFRGLHGRFGPLRWLLLGRRGLDADEDGVADDQEARHGLETAALHQLRQPRARLPREARLRPPGHPRSRVRHHAFIHYICYILQ